MISVLAAELVLLLHVLFVVFAVVGAPLVLWRRWIIWLHLPAVAWAATVEFYGLICPLTPLENWLRTGSGAMPYEDGFVAHYLWPMLYPAGLTREIQTGLGWAVLVLNVVVYAFICWYWRKRSRPGTGA
jgi:hypothetical protein